MIGDIEIDPFNSDRMMYVTGAISMVVTILLTGQRRQSKIEVKATE